MKITNLCTLIQLTQYNSCLLFLTAKTIQLPVCLIKYIYKKKTLHKFYMYIQQI